MFSTKLVEFSSPMVLNGFPSLKPELTVLGVCHHLAPNEGQKEIARRTKPCRKRKGEKQND
jgi:hypothetical protein